MYSLLISLYELTSCFPGGWYSNDFDVFFTFNESQPSLQHPSPVSILFILFLRLDLLWRFWRTFPELTPGISCHSNLNIIWQTSPHALSPSCIHPLDELFYPNCKTKHIQVQMPHTGLTSCVPFLPGCLNCIVFSCYGWIKYKAADSQNLTLFQVFCFMNNVWLPTPLSPISSPSTVIPHSLFLFSRMWKWLVD